MNTLEVVILLSIAIVSASLGVWWIVRGRYDKYENFFGEYVSNEKI